MLSSSGNFFGRRGLRDHLPLIKHRIGNQSVINGLLVTHRITATETIGCASSVRITSPVPQHKKSLGNVEWNRNKSFVALEQEERSFSAITWLPVYHQLPINHIQPLWDSSSGMSSVYLQLSIVSVDSLLINHPLVHSKRKSVVLGQPPVYHSLGFLPINSLCRFRTTCSQSDVVA